MGSKGGGVGSNGYGAKGTSKRKTAGANAYGKKAAMAAATAMTALPSISKTEASKFYEKRRRLAMNAKKRYHPDQSKLDAIQMEPDHPRHLSFGADADEMISNDGIVKLTVNERGGWDSHYQGSEEGEWIPSGELMNLTHAESAARGNHAFEKAVGIPGRKVPQLSEIEFETMMSDATHPRHMHETVASEAWESADGNLKIATSDLDGSFAAFVRDGDGDVWEFVVEDNSLQGAEQRGRERVTLWNAVRDEMRRSDG